MSTFGITNPEIISPLDTSQKNINDHTELIIRSGETSVFICPEMGGMVTRFQVKTRDDVKKILYFEKSDFENSGKKPKIGIPVLMPFGGSDAIVRQHGGFREVPWVWEAGTESSITLSLNTENIKNETLLSELKTKFGNDLDFKYTIRISVSEGELRYEINIKNNGKSEMSVAPGLHPYFRVDKEKQPEMKSNLPGFDLSDWDGKSIIFDRPGDAPVWFTIPGVGKMTVDCDPKFNTFVVWSKQNDKGEKEGYVCVEPWTGRINDPDKRINIAPGEKLQLAVNFRLEKE